MNSFGIMLSIVEKPSGKVVPRFIFLFLTIHAVPSVWEILLLNTIHMKPFSFAIRIFTFDHFSKWKPFAVTVFRFHLIVQKLIVSIGWIVACSIDACCLGANVSTLGSAINSCQQFSHGFSPVFEDCSLFFSLLLHFIFEFSIKLFIKVTDQDFELLWHLIFFTIKSVQFLLLSDNFLVIIPERCREVSSLGWSLLFCGRTIESAVKWLFMFLELMEKLVLELVERRLESLGFFIKSPYESEMAVDVIGNEIHFVNKLIEISDAHSHGWLGGRKRF